MSEHVRDPLMGTILIKKNTEVIRNMGTSGFTVTATREGDGLSVQMEFEQVSEEETKAMIGALLAQLEDLHGERFVANCIAHYFVANCIAHYMEETGKPFLQEGERTIGMIRGHEKERKR